MFNTGAMPSLADIAAVTGNKNDGGWGDGNGWWVLIILFAIFGGWGNGGWGGNGANGGATPYATSALTQADLQRGFDTQSIVSKLDGISNGLCDGFYTQNTALMNGFHGVDNAICNLGYQTQQGFNTTNVALMQGQNALQSQLANCCCETREAIQGVNYNMAQNTCALQNTMNSNTRDIIDSQNAGTRAILDYLCNEKISSLQAENNDLRRAASQDRQSALLTTAMASQTQQIINAVNPAPIPAYQVPNPNVYYGCGCNSGCGC
ncbi:MAG: hypothetical protein ACLR48_10350 [Ruminococcus sp.]